MAHTYTHLLYHLVFSTKYREPHITPSIRDPLYRYIGGILRQEGGILLEIGGIEDHVHLLVRLRPTAAISDTLRLVKANSSKWLNEGRVPQRFRWQTGYGAFTVGKSMAGGVARYIRNQPQHHRKRSFRDEFVELLDLNDVEYDVDRIWD